MDDIEAELVCADAVASYIAHAHNCKQVDESDQRL